jgi:H+-transporting ATPase
MATVKGEPANEPPSPKPSTTQVPALAAASIPTTLAILQVDPNHGLSKAEADTRRAHHGYNEVLETKRHPVRQFLSKFWGISAWMLELIMLLSVALRKYSDLVVVGTLLVINSTLGFLQERRAAGVVDTLRRQLQISARVLRDGRWLLIPARELVPGDIIRLRAGDVVPADVKLLNGSLRLDESALTGESTDVDRTCGGLLSAGAVARHGEGTGVVLLTGAATYFGRTTQLVQEARPRLHIEGVIAKVVRWLFAIVGTLLSVVLALSIMRGVPLVEVVPLLLVLLMSAVPVALPVMFTVSMAVGSKELAKRGVLVTRLSASEDAATMSVLCVDKTGTITMNCLTVTGVVAFEPATETDVLTAGALASQDANQDPIDQAFLAAARERNVPPAKSKPLTFAPFDAATRRTEAVVELDGHRTRFMKGAVRTVAESCGLDRPAVEALESQVAAAAARGYRTLAVARGPDPGRPTLMGLVTLYDPPRPDAQSLIETLKGLGIGVKMLTGDAWAVASEIGRGIGLPNIRPVAELKGSSAGGAAGIDILTGADGLAEVYPEDKYVVVRRLQAAGHVVGMTGDGVNDAPALRQAEVGIAVSTATDVAKGAASVVLTHAGLTNIVTLVVQGRIIYQRILTWVLNKISRTILKAGFVAVAFVVTGKFVVSAFAMLLLVFMTDFAKIALSTDRVRPSPAPESWNISGYVLISVALGLLMILETLGLLWFYWSRLHLATSNRTLYTLCFLTLLYFAAFSVVSVRERRWFWKSPPSAPLIAALIADITVGTVLPFVGLPDLAPLPWGETFAILAWAMISCLVVNDSAKVAMIRWRARFAVSQ